MEGLGTVPIIIVLGGRIIHGTPSRSLQHRLQRALIEYREGVRYGNSPFIVCSGGHGTHRSPSEAAVMASWLIARGIPEHAIFLEDSSRTTQENFGCTKALIHSLSPVPGLLPTGEVAAVIVTSWVHVPRAHFWASYYGFHPIMRGTSVPLRALPKAIVWEMGASMMGVIRGVFHRAQSRRRIQRVKNEKLS